MNENYPLFTKWKDILNWILDRCDGFPKSIRFTFTNRISNFSLEILELIIESIYNKNRTKYLKQINMNLEKLRVFFRIACDRRYVSIKQYEYISRELNTAGKMTGGWAKTQ